MVPPRAVFFDVDFTLIHPGPTFHGVGYRDFCARHGTTVDPEAFDRAVAQASTLLEAPLEIYDPEIFVRYTIRIIEGMGGRGPGVEPAARDIYDEWAACHHFDLCEDVPDVLRSIHAGGVHRADLEHAAMPDLVPTPLRARGVVRGHAFILGSRLHEAASQHLRGGAAQGGRDARRIGDGGRQPGPRHRGGAPHRHARRPRRAQSRAGRLTRRRLVIRTLRELPPLLGISGLFEVPGLKTRPTDRLRLGEQVLAAAGLAGQEEIHGAVAAAEVGDEDFARRHPPAEREVGRFRHHLGKPGRDLYEHPPRIERPRLGSPGSTQRSPSCDGFTIGARATDASRPTPDPDVRRRRAARAGAIRPRTGRSVCPHATGYWTSRRCSPHALRPRSRA